MPGIDGSGRSLGKDLAAITGIDAGFADREGRGRSTSYLRHMATYP